MLNEYKKGMIFTNSYDDKIFLISVNPYVIEIWYPDGKEETEVSETYLNKLKHIGEFTVKTRKGDIIKVVGSSSICNEFMGRYGVVKEYSHRGKWKVEFNASTETMGGLSHTICEKDFEVVGILNS